jgi:outer membrane protein
MKLRRKLAWLMMTPGVALAQSDETLLGAGMRIRPAYDGSNTNQRELVPVVRYYGRTLFARTTQGILEGGARLSLTPGLKLGAQIAYEGGRKTSESGFLEGRNSPSIGPGASAGLHVEWDGRIGPAPVTLLGRWRQNLNADRGAQLDFRPSVGVYSSGPLGLGIFAQATWANRKSVRTYYGEPGYDPGGGLLSTGLGLQGGYTLSREWMLVGSVEGRRLHGDAAGSPLTERKWNYYASGGLAYRF